MGVFEALGGWMVSPGLFLAGAAAISVPILIHSIQSSPLSDD